MRIPTQQMPTGAVLTAHNPTAAAHGATPYTPNNQSTAAGAMSQAVNPRLQLLRQNLLAHALRGGTPSGQPQAAPQHLAPGPPALPTIK